MSQPWFVCLFSSRILLNRPFHNLSITLRRRGERIFILLLHRLSRAFDETFSWEEQPRIIRFLLGRQHRKDYRATLNRQRERERVRERERERGIERERKRKREKERERERESCCCLQILAGFWANCKLCPIFPQKAAAGIIAATLSLSLSLSLSRSSSSRRERWKVSQNVLLPEASKWTLCLFPLNGYQTF
jgi:hypothetical protein